MKNDGFLRKNHLVRRVILSFLRFQIRYFVIFTFQKPFFEIIFLKFVDSEKNAYLCATIGKEPELFY